MLSALLLLSLATWRIAHMLVYEDGPWEIFPRLRRATGVRFDANSQPYAETMLGQLLLCVWCTSVWVGGGLTLIYFFLPPLVWQLIGWVGSLSTLAIFFEITYQRFVKDPDGTR